MISHLSVTSHARCSRSLPRAQRRMTSLQIRFLVKPNIIFFVNKLKTKIAQIWEVIMRRVKSQPDAVVVSRAGPAGDGRGTEVQVLLAEQGQSVSLPFDNMNIHHWPTFIQQQLWHCCWKVNVTGSSYCTAGREKSCFLNWIRDFCKIICLWHFQTFYKTIT